jgi:hypothetical protein
LASGVSLLTFRIAPAELRQSYDFNCNGLDSESPNTCIGVCMCFVWTTLIKRVRKGLCQHLAGLLNYSRERLRVNHPAPLSGPCRRASSMSLLLPFSSGGMVSESQQQPPLPCALHLTLPLLDLLHGGCCCFELLRGARSGPPRA